MARISSISPIELLLAIGGPRSDGSIEHEREAQK
jgi:hypothetical protein